MRLGPMKNYCVFCKGDKEKKIKVYQDSGQPIIFKYGNTSFPSHHITIPINYKTNVKGIVLLLFKVN